MNHIVKIIKYFPSDGAHRPCSCKVVSVGLGFGLSIEDMAFSNSSAFQIGCGGSAT